MAQIKSYDIQQTATAPLPGRSPERLFATPEAFGDAAGGEAIGQAYQNVGNDLSKTSNVLMNVAEEQEKSQVQVQMAQTRQHLTTSLDQQLHSSAAGDPHFADNFAQNMSDQLSQLGDNYNTRAGQNLFQVEKARLTGDLLDKAQSYQISIAGMVAKNNFVSMNDSNRNTLVTDPSQYETILQSTNDTINDPNSPFARMGMEDRLNLARWAKDGLGLAAVEGAARVAPQIAKQQLDGGYWDDKLSAQARVQAMGIVDRGINAQERDTQTARIQQQQQVDKQQMTSVGNYLKDYGNTGVMLASKVVSDPNLTDLQKNLMVGKDGVIANIDPNDTTYGKNFVQASQFIYSGQAFSATGLIVGMKNQEFTPTGAAQLKKMSEMIHTPEGAIELNAQKQVIDQIQSQVIKGGLVASDPVGQKNFNAAMNAFYPAWESAKSNGATVSQMTDPKDPNYMGKLAQNFIRSPAQAIADITKVQNAVPQPTKTDIEFLKSNPDKAAQFDSRFGKGEAVKLLGTP